MNESHPRRWYLAKEKKRLGPFTAEQLRQMAATGAILPSDMVLEEGKQKWRPISEASVLVQPNQRDYARAKLLGLATAGTVMLVVISLWTVGAFRSKQGSPNPTQQVEVKPNTQPVKQAGQDGHAPEIAEGEEPPAYWIAKLDQAEPVRSKAIDSLVKMGAKAIPDLRKAVSDKNRATITGAIAAIGRIGPDARDAVPTLMLLLDNVERRTEVAEALGLIGPAAQDAAIVLAGLLKKQNPVEPKLLTALERINSKAAFHFKVMRKLEETQKSLQSSYEFQAARFERAKAEGNIAEVQDAASKKASIAIAQAEIAEQLAQVEQRMSQELSRTQTNSPQKSGGLQDNSGTEGIHNRRFWRFAPEYGDGYFKQLPDGTWEERGKGDRALMGVWVERGRTTEYVELEDRKRGYLTRLGAGKAWIASIRDGKFAPSPHGNWENEPSGLRPAQKQPLSEPDRQKARRPERDKRLDELDARERAELLPLQREEKALREQLANGERAMQKLRKDMGGLPRSFGVPKGTRFSPVGGRDIREIEDKGRERLEKLEREYKQLRQEYLGKLRNVEEQIRVKQATFEQERRSILNGP